jgi:leucine dehydrogenase
MFMLAHYDRAEIMQNRKYLQYNFRNFDFALANKITTHQAALTIAQNRIDQRKLENKKIVIQYSVEGSASAENSG